jgi:radical SAM superfamily enzyme
VNQDEIVSFSGSMAANATARLSEWPLHSIKFHQLQVIHGTGLAREYKEHPEEFIEFTLEEYLHLMMEVLERIRPDMVVERIAGEVAPTMSARQGWGVRYDDVLNRFEKLLEIHDSWQGKLYQTSE